VGVVNRVKEADYFKFSTNTICEDIAQIKWESSLPSISSNPQLKYLLAKLSSSYISTYLK